MTTSTRSPPNQAISRRRAGAVPTQVAWPNLRHVMAEGSAAWPNMAMGTYEIGRIEPEQIDRAYALVRVAQPAVQLGAWRRYVADLDETSDWALHREVLVACNALGYIQGLCISSIVQLANDRVLDVPIFIVVSAADERGVRAELLNNLESRAAGLGCSQLRIWTQTADNWRLHLIPDAAWDAAIDLSIPVPRR